MLCTLFDLLNLITIHITGYGHFSNDPHSIVDCMVSHACHLVMSPRAGHYYNVWFSVLHLMLQSCVAIVIIKYLGTVKDIFLMPSDYLYSWDDI